MTIVIPPPPVTVPPPPSAASWVPTVPVSIPELPPPPRVVYDTETYPNFFCLVARAMESDQTWTFEISPRRNDLLALLAWIDDLSRRGVEMIGFNNLGFDYPVLHEIIVNPQCRTPDAIYQKAMSIIEGNRFGSMVWESDRRVPQLDLFKIHHFDNKARSTGLKALQFAMRSDSVEDLPFPVGIMLTPQQMDVTLRYCLHDVTETKKFAEKSRESIELRRALTAKYKRNFMNHNDTKIGKDYLIMRLGEEVCYTRDPSTGKRAPRQTLRPTIALGEVILPYVRYSHPGFNAVLGWLRRQVITETKGVFGNIEMTSEDDEGKAFGVDLNHQNIADLPRHADPSTVKTKNGGLRMTKLNCRVNGFTFVFGTGGIHGSVENTIIESDDEFSVWDWDVESYYPNLAIKNRLYPEHLGEAFCDDYEDVFQQRKQFKKGTPENAVMKLALNGTYGDSNNPYSPFYDPKFTMAITINGQLLLCMLAEQLFNVPDLQLIQINTDGLTIRIPRRHEWLMHEICRHWQSVTKLSLESAQYRKMNILNVNNYQAVTLDGKAKLKGAYLAKRGWHQDQSALIVPMAAEAVMVKGASLEEFIRLHTDPFDFMCRAKAPRGSRLMVGDRQTQNTLRYYVSTDGQPLTKVSPPVEGAVEGQYKRKNGVSDQAYQAWHAANGNVWNPEFHTGNKSVYATRVMSICSGWRITECNAASQFSWNNLDFQWYIDEAKKLIIGHDHLLGSPV